MKVTTELKNIVKNAFSEKATAYRKRKCEEYHREYVDALKWIESSSEYKEYVEAFNRLREMLEHDVAVRKEKYDNNSPSPYIYRTVFKALAPRDIICESTHRYFENDEELAKFEKEQNALLVKLTYEKDMDRIQALLAEYGIEI